MWQGHWLHTDVIHSHSVNPELRDNNIKIPAEMVQNLMILHSYILVKVTEFSPSAKRLIGSSTQPVATSSTVSLIEEEEKLAFLQISVCHYYMYILCILRVLLGTESLIQIVVLLYCCAVLYVKG